MLYPIRGQVAAAAILLALAACGGGSGEESQPPTGGGGLQPTLASIQDNIFTPSCAKSSCHTGAMAEQGLRLDPGFSWGRLVGIVSPQDMSLVRVRPTDPDGSFLIHKLEGMGPGGAPIVGMQMPDDGPPFLQAAQIQVIKEWILNGAPQ
jgi:hypothetical protein